MKQEASALSYISQVLEVNQQLPSQIWNKCIRSWEAGNDYNIDLSQGRVPSFSSNLFKFIRMIFNSFCVKISIKTLIHYHH